MATSLAERLKVKVDLPWWGHIIVTMIFGVVFWWMFTTALDQNKQARLLQQQEAARDKDYIERTEKEKVLLLEAITDIDSAQMITAEDFRLIWSNLKCRSLFGKTKAEMMSMNLVDMLPPKVAHELNKLVKGYHFEKTNPQQSIKGYIQKDGQKIPVLITFVSVEKSWTAKNDGYFIFTFYPSEEKVAAAL